MKLNSQKNKILNAMLNNRDRIWWSAKDFQSGEHFIGYEATARMSELLEYPFIKSAKDGRFRVLAIDWDKEDEIEEYKEMIGE
jgi:hypothetical protein